MNTSSGNSSVRDALQLYFDRIYPHSRIEENQTMYGQVYIRFDLGGELGNGTAERVDQAVERALTIFNDLFQDPDAELWVLIYEFPGENFYRTSNEYLYDQLEAEKFNAFFQQKIQGTEEEALVILGRLKVSDINIDNIVRGIANTEMGFDPGIDQMVYFFDPVTDRAFYMYDDRGCIAWSNKAEKLKEIYQARKSWIVPYHRSEIDDFFKPH